MRPTPPPARLCCYASALPSTSTPTGDRRRTLTLPTGFIHPCLPMIAPRPPSGPDWLHEIKHDEFRIIARKAGSQVKLYSRPVMTSPIASR